MNILNTFEKKGKFYRLDDAFANNKTNRTNTTRSNQKQTLNETRQNNTNRNNSTTSSTRSNTSSNSSSSRNNTSSSSSSSRSNTSSRTNNSSNRKLELNEKRQNSFTPKDIKYPSALDYLKNTKPGKIKYDLSSTGTRREKISAVQEKARRDRISKDLSSKSGIEEKIQTKIYDKNKQKESSVNDIISFTNYVTDCTPTTYKNGVLCYVIDKKTAGVLSVGPSIVLKYGKDYFAKYGIDVDTLKEGDTIAKSTVDKITRDILADKRKEVLNVLEKNGINDLSDNQIDALVSRSYSVGNINDFPAAYKKYGNTEDLYTNYLSTLNGKGTIYEDSVTRRRQAEMELFKNGYKTLEDNTNNIGSGGSTKDDYNKLKDELFGIKNDLAADRIEKKDQEQQEKIVRDPLADYLDKLKSEGKDISDITDSSMVRDPLADYLDKLKSLGIDISDITNSDIDILTNHRITNNNYTEEDINKFKNILWHEYGGSLTGNFSDDAFTLLTIGATIVNNATAYGGKDSNKSWANSLEDAITNRKYLYENGRNYIYGTYNPSSLGVPASTDAFLTEVAKICLSGKYTIPSNLRGQSARYIMDSYDDQNNKHYLVGNEWYSDNNHDVVIYPLNEGKKNDKTIYTAEVSNVDVFGNEFKTVNSEVFKEYAKSLESKILENDLIKNKYSS